ncbi:MAG: [protein-PII] uridylyltransferase [Thermoguttaceae bacterium]|jgi:[protein-PII] uridylyltransferase
MSRLRPNILEARARLAVGCQELQRSHQEGASGVDLCRAASKLRDEVILRLVGDASADRSVCPPDTVERLAVVAHGGYGRREVCPFSDVDLMVLCPNRLMDAARPLAERLFRDIFDAGLVVGHSLRTPEEAWRLACEDAQVCTSLIESRLLSGSRPLFDDYWAGFNRRLRRNARRLVAAAETERARERIRYGETVYMLEPNVKRSRGGLRDVHLLRWLGTIRYGFSEPADLVRLGHLSPKDYRDLAETAEYLLRLRNEMHFHAGKPGDVLSRSEQLRIAALRGYQASAGMLPVEQFMRDHFRRTEAVSQIVARFLAKARSSPRRAALTALFFGRRVGGGFYAGPAMIAAGVHGRRRLACQMEAVMQIVDLANLYDKPIEPDTWEIVRRNAARLPEDISPGAMRHFLSLVGHPARLGDLLRLLHEVRLLERFIPAFEHARGLLQFNQYHKYTVDEHCFRAVDMATDFQRHTGAIGQAYRETGRKHLLHLALLLHDLGKGHADDHSQVGARLARETARLLGLSPEEAETLEFLVGKHLIMNHLAFRRDMSDEQVLVRFAVDAGSPERLRMLFVMTAADLGAIGPGVWDSWKEDVLTDLYRRANRHLSGETGQGGDEQLGERRRALVALLAGAGHEALAPVVDSLPAGTLRDHPLEETAADLALFDSLGQNPAAVHCAYNHETKTARISIATGEQVAPGIFHRLTGAISSKGLQILSAEINTLAGGLVLDHFLVVDPDYAGQPPPERFEQIRRALVESLECRSGWSPSFRKTWIVGAHRQPKMRVAQTRIEVDNTTSDRFTILDIFAADRPGLLYAIARTLFEMDLSVARAKIGTYLDQVVDVFYVTDVAGKKIESATRIQQIRSRLLDVILSAAAR